MLNMTARHAVLVSLLSFMATVAPSSRTDDPSSVRAVATALPRSEHFLAVESAEFREFCTHMCVNPCNGNAQAHKSEFVGSLNTRNGHDYCVDGGDCAGHPACSQFSASEPLQVRIRALVAEAASGSASAIHELLQAGRGDAQIVYNAERRSIQVFTCEPGVVTAHVNLSLAQIAELGT